jgi:hypothetical protein
MDVQTDKIVGCAAINEHVSKPIPDVLWHYTSFGAFQGIVTSKKIWATEYRFLNDQEEIRHAKELAQALVDEERENIGDFAVRATIRSAVNVVFSPRSILHEENQRVMVASFSEVGDQLSQWRGYANDSRGVSVGFDLQSLRPPADIGTTVTFAPCVYGLDQKRALLKAVFAHYVNGIQAWWNPIMEIARAKKREGATIGPNFSQELVSEHREQLNKALRESLRDLQFDLLRVAPLLKNEAFSEEKEWRLVLPWMPKPGLPKRLEFRCTGDTLVPYIAWPFNLKHEEAPIPCKELILGPGSHPSAEIGVNLFLQKEKIQGLARRSQIPYRPT